MKLPDRFERMATAADYGYTDRHHAQKAAQLLRRLYAQIRREIRRQQDTHQDVAALGALTALLTHLDRLNTCKEPT